MKAKIHMSSEVVYIRVNGTADANTLKKLHDLLLKSNVRCGGGGTYEAGVYTQYDIYIHRQSLENSVR